MSSGLKAQNIKILMKLSDRKNNKNEIFKNNALLNNDSVAKLNKLINDFDKTSEKMAM